MNNFIHIKNTPNIGDLWCTPSRYYNFGEHVIYDLDCVKHDPITEIIDYGPVIIGGGAVASRAISIAKQIKRRQPNRKVIGWGIGHTRRGTTNHLDRAEILDGYKAYFDLMGDRDYFFGNSKNYVPCVSCKSHLFDKFMNVPIEYEYCVYGHRAVMPLLGSGFPYLDNEHSNFSDVIYFMSRAEVVITSSYHGVYWAQLLGKKVFCIPFGSKFHYFKYSPIYASSVYDCLLMDKPKVIDGYLEECGEINDKFYYEVMRLIHE